MSKVVFTTEAVMSGQVPKTYRDGNLDNLRILLISLTGVSLSEISSLTKYQIVEFLDVDARTQPGDAEKLHFSAVTLPKRLKTRKEAIRRDNLVIFKKWLEAENKITSATKK